MERLARAAAQFGVEASAAQRDAYANLNNAVLHAANQGVTINEIHNVYTLPESLKNTWATHSYHGSEEHNSRAVINRYLGYWDANPATLIPLSPGDSAPLYVEMMGGSAKILSRGQALVAQGQYLLAAHADHVLLNQSGAVLIEGFGVYQTYFKSALEKLNVTPHVFKVGTYKSFVEPYTRDEMSPESKEANQRWLDQLWQSYVTDVAEQREIEPDAVAPDKDHFLELLRKAGGNAASYALDNGLVDQLATRDEMTQAVIKEVGESEDHGWKGVGLKEYLAAIPEQYPQSGKDEVGLITASGAIMDGIQPAGTIGGDSLSELLAEARTSLQKVDAVLVEAQGIASNTREATTDLGVLRGEVESSLRKVDGLINDINRKWPFARDTEIKLP